MSLLLHHFSLSPPTPRSPRSHFEHFHRMPNSSHPPTDRSRRVTSSDWDPGGWRTTTQLQRRSSSANLSNTPVWSRSSGTSAVSVKQPNRMLNKSASRALASFRPSTYPGVRLGPSLAAALLAAFSSILWEMISCCARCTGHLHSRRCNPAANWARPKSAPAFTIENTHSFARGFRRML